MFAELFLTVWTFAGLIVFAMAMENSVGKLNWKWAGFMLLCGPVVWTFLAIALFFLSWQSWDKSDSCDKVRDRVANFTKMLDK